MAHIIFASTPDTSVWICGIGFIIGFNWQLRIRICGLCIAEFEGMRSNPKHVELRKAEISPSTDQR